MIREKDLEEPNLERLVRDIQTALEPWDPAILLNGAPEIAARCSLHGVHLPQGRSPSDARAILGQGALIGVSTHGEAEYLAAEAEGADYVTLSPIFVSTSKGRHLPPLGQEALRDAAAALSLPVLALGGVTRENAAVCQESGAAGIAVLGPIMGARDSAAAAGAILTAWNRG